MSVHFDRRARRAWTLRVGLGSSVLSLVLAGCAALPISGPTGHQIVKEQRDPQSGLHYQLVEVNDFSNLPVVPAPSSPPVETAPIQATDLIGPGDILSISLYETGVTLFAGSGGGGSALAAATGAGAGSSIGAGSGGNDGAAHATNLLPMRVDDQGLIRFPFVGKMQAAGLTSGELQTKIRSALRGMSQNPQVVVTIGESLTNSVIVGGEVAKAGRLTLQTNRETVADVVALSGGYRGETKDLLLRVDRGGQVMDFRLADVMSGTVRDMIARPGDRIDIIRQPLSFSVMGAAGRVEQIPFAAPTMTLAEAVALSGGANPSLGDAKAVFIFRLESGPDQKPLPMVYHVNMMHAGAIFLSQRFPMQDKDVLYVGNAGFNQPSKLIQVISQLFSPVVAVSSGVAAVKQ
jgi:polysaccharide biosynthesis/export protein